MQLELSISFPCSDIQHLCFLPVERAVSRGSSQGRCFFWLRLLPDSALLQSNFILNGSQVVYARGVWYHPPKIFSYLRSRNNQASCPSTRLRLQAGPSATPSKSRKEKPAVNCPAPELAALSQLWDLLLLVFKTNVAIWTETERSNEGSSSAGYSLKDGITSTMGQLSAAAVSSTDSAACRTIHCSVPSTQAPRKMCVLNQVSQQ